MAKGVLILVLVLVLVLSVGVFAFQNEPEGFRGLKWRDPPSEDMEIAFEDNISKTYIRPEDKMSLGEAELELIFYAFVKVDGEFKFFSASLCFENESRFTILKTICEERFGPPTIEEMYKLTWFNEGEVGIFLNYDFMDSAGILQLNHTDLFIIWVDLDKKEKAKGAESDW